MKKMLITGLTFLSAGIAIAETDPLIIFRYSDNKRASEVVETLPDGAIAPIELYVGRSSSRQLTMPIGQPPYSWHVFSGTLPDGITLSPSGVLSGTPTTPTINKIQLLVTDSTTQKIETNRFDVTVYDDLVAFDTISNSYVSKSLSIPIEASGGKRPYRYSVTSGSIPQGLSISNGKIEGTPQVAGTFHASITVEDANSISSTADFTFEITEQLIGSYDLPDGYVNEPYSAAFAASGGIPPFHWEFLLGDRLPTGLTLASDGSVTGVPTQSGTTSYNISVFDNDIQDAPGNGSISIYNLPTIAVDDIGPIAPNHAFTENLIAQGGKPDVTWSYSGIMPPGISLSPSGRLSGTPSGIGTYSPTLRVTDANSRYAEKPISIHVFDTLVAIHSSTLDGYVGDPVSFELTSSGGKSPLNWVGTNLPSGISIDQSSNSLVGVPGGTGSGTISLEVTDALGASDTSNISYRIYRLPEITSVPQDGRIDEPYTFALSADGGKSPLSWEKASGDLPTGLVINEDGVLSGTPSTAGQFDFVARVRDANGKVATKAANFSIYDYLVASAGAVSDAYIEEGYSHKFSVSGGKAPYSFSSSNLPAGLSLNTTTGELTGSPTVAGINSATIVVTDSLGETASAALTFSVYDLPQLTPTSIADAYVGTPFNHAFDATGGKRPFSWRISSGSLPSGMGINNTGVLHGTPSTVGTYSFTASVTDANGRQAHLPSTIKVNSALVASVGVAPTGYLSNSFYHTVTASGGVSPYTFSASNLPSGLSINASTGVISGTPSAQGTTNATITVRDASNVTASANLYISVFSLPSITNSPVATRTQGTSYSFTYNATGGRTPYTWSRSSGSLPPGMSLSSSGVLSGTPSTPGTYSFTVRVADGNGKTATRTSSMTINANLIAKTLTSRGTSTSIKSLFTNAEWTSTTAKQVTIPSGHEIGANNLNYAVEIPGGWGGQLTLINNGIISGRGGAANSGTGGNAIQITGRSSSNQTVAIVNNGTIRAGGGGGGRGGNGGPGHYYQTSNQGPYYVNGQTEWRAGRAGVSQDHNANFFVIMQNGQLIGNVPAPYANSTSVVINGTTYVRGAFRQDFRRAIGGGRDGSNGEVLFSNFDFYIQSSVLTPTTGGAGGQGGGGQGYGGGPYEGTAGQPGGTNAGVGNWGNWGGAWGKSGNRGLDGHGGHAGAGSPGQNGGPAGFAIQNPSYATISGSGQRLGR